MKASQPIGIFDSGIGGLTVAQAIHDLLPHENIIYFGDTAHMPYGEKSPQAVARYSKKIAKHLIAEGCKTLVIACNTASALAYDAILKETAAEISIINVIDPVVKEAASHREIERLGVIGTRATIQSGIYSKRLNALTPEIYVESIATPLFAQMIEEGFINGIVSREVIQKYLGQDDFKSVNALILGCTHYPLIQNEIKAFMSDRVKIFDSPKIVANELQDVLLKANLLNPSLNKGTVACEVSQLTENFVRLSRVFFQGELKIEVKTI